VKLVGLFASIVLLVSAYAAYREAAPFLTGGMTARDVTENGGGAGVFGISSYSQRLALDQCRESLLSVAASLRPANERQAAAKTCETMARDILQRNPADAYAATILAAAGFAEGNPEMARRSYRLSWQIAPNEFWLGALRLDLARDHILPDAGDLAGVVESDLMLHGRSQNGRVILAHWYLQDPAARKILAGTLDRLPENDKAAFLDVVYSLNAE